MAGTIVDTRDRAGNKADFLPCAGDGKERLPHTAGQQSGSSSLPRPWVFC